MTDDPSDSRDFFVSFTSADRAWASWIAWTLEAAGYSVVFQDWDFAGNFVLEMDRAHSRSRRTVAVLSPEYLRSRYAASEWAARFAEDATSAYDLLIPVRIRPCALEGLLAQIVYVDFVACSEAAARGKLLRRVEGIRLKPDEAPLFPGDVDHSALHDRPAFPVARPAEGHGGATKPANAVAQLRMEKASTVNDGIMISGGTINAGSLAVGKGARAKYVVTEAKAFSGTRMRIKQLMALIEAANLSKEQYDHLASAAREIQQQVDVGTINHLILNALFDTMRSSARDHTVIAQAIDRLRSYVNTLMD